MALYKYQAEQRLQISDLALKAISQGVVITTPDQKIVSVNQAFTDQTGYSSSDIVGLICRILQGPQPALRVSRRYVILSSGASYFSEI